MPMEPTSETPNLLSPKELPEYEGIVGQELRKHGFLLRQKSPTETGCWVWKQNHGWRVWNAEGDEFWLCKLCHSNFNPEQHWFRSSKSTSRAKLHMREEHGINAKGAIPPSLSGKKKRKIDQCTSERDTGTAPSDTSFVPTDPFTFHSWFLQCVIAGHIALRGLEFTPLQRLVECANPQARTLSLATVSQWIKKAYDRQLSVVARILASATSKVSLSLNDLIPGKGDRLLGVTAHFIVRGGKRTSVLVSLPRRPNGPGTCDAEEMITAIVAEHNLEKSLGYIITNNPSGNSAHMTAFTSDNLPAAETRWMHCSSRILTQVARTVLFGSAADSLDRELLGTRDDEVQRTDFWRRRGPYGKLRNTVAYLKRYHTHWEERLKEDQRFSMRGAKVDAFKRVEHDDTGWEATDDLIATALHLRPALDEFISKDIDDHHASCHDRRDVSRPPITDERLGPNDWQVLKTYHDALQHIKDAKGVLQGPTGSHFGAIWQVLPQFDALLAQLDKSRQRQFPHANRRAASPHLQNVQPKGAAPKAAAAQECIEEVHNDATPQGDGHTALAHRFDAEIDRAAVEYQSNANISTAWQIVHDHCEILHGNAIYIAAVVLHPRIKWRYFKAKWRARRDRLSGCVSALNRHWRDNYKDKSTDSGSTGEGTVRGNKRAADEWSDSERWNLDQLGEYESEQPDRSYESTDSPVDYWVRRRKMWPQLSAMALDIYSVPVTAGGPDLVLNRASKLWPAAELNFDDERRACLMCLRAWQSSGILELDDELFEGTDLMPDG